MSVVLERVEDELELILIVVTPKRSNKNYSAPRLWLEQRISELLVEMCMHEGNSSSLTMPLSLRHDCLVLEIHTMGVCD